MHTTNDIREWIAQYKKRFTIEFPKIRKVQGSLLSHEIVSVQPMTLPSGLNFWLDYTFTSGSKAKNKPEE